MNGFEALKKLRELNKSGDKKVYFDIIEKELKKYIIQPRSFTINYRNGGVDIKKNNPPTDC